jgi:hypothetical protein
MKARSKYLFLFFSIVLSLNLMAQKKMVPVSQSALAGIALPTGSKQDKRWLSESSAQVLLELESKKAKTGVKNMEVFYLPSVAASGFNSDSLVAQLTTAGWEITGIEGDDKYVWLQKNGRYLIAYFQTDEKQTQLYFGEAVEVPSFE